MIFSFIHKYIYIGAAVVFLGLCGAVGYFKYQSVSKDEAVIEAKRDLKDANAAIEKLNANIEQARKETKAAEAAVADRDAKLRELAQKNGEKRAKIKKTTAANPAWSNTPLPDSLRRDLQNKRLADPTGVPAGQPDPGLPKADQ